MINLNDIETCEIRADEKDRYDEAFARVRVSAAIKLEPGSSQELMRDACEGVQRTVWIKIYGDHEQALLEVHRAIMMIQPADMEAQQKQAVALELLSAITAKFKFPTPCQH